MPERMEPSGAGTAERFRLSRAYSSRLWNGLSQILCLRHLPDNWLSKDKLDVMDDFVNYAKPLIGERWPEVKIENGLQRFAHFNIEFIERKLEGYIPVHHRGI